MKFSCKDSFEVSEKEVSSAYAMAIHSGDLVLKKWDSKVEAFLARVHFLHANFPEYGIEPLDEDSKRLILRKFAGQSSWKSIRNTEVYPFVRDAFGDDQLRTIEEVVQAEIDLGNGRKPYRISYGPDRAQISAYLQDLYDVSNHPCINHGKYKLIVDILGAQWPEVLNLQKICLRFGDILPSSQKGIGGPVSQARMALIYNLKARDLAEKILWSIGLDPNWDNSRTCGRYGEWLGRRLLRRKGYRIVVANWRSSCDRRQEIDLVCRKDGVLVSLKFALARKMLW